VIAGMKLIIVGVAMLVTATGMALFTNVNPATLFIGGIVCTFLGFINVISRPEAGPAVSAGDVSEARSLANLQNYGSVDRSARLIDSP
jgi:hypothetical protein